MSRDAERRLPPMLGAVTDTALSANTASSAIAVEISGSGTGQYTFSSPSKFNIIFDTDSTITDPASAVYPYAAGVIDLWCRAGMYYKVRTEDACTFRHWKSGRDKT